jgi:hypothetical protein
MQSEMKMQSGYKVAVTKVNSNNSWANEYIFIVIFIH